MEEINCLSQEDKLQLRINYSDICKALKPCQEFLDKLKDRNVLCKEDTDYLYSSTRTEQQKTEYLVFQVLITTGTYDVLSSVTQALEECGQQQVVKLLPSEWEDDSETDQGDESQNNSPSKVTGQFLI